ncbi:MAG: hypothetical protein PVG07_05095, partial [Acidobacteriota bacterium]
SRAALSFNYLGQFDQTFSEDALFRLAPEPVGPVQSPRGARAHLLEVVGAVRGDRLALTWTYSASAHERRTVERVAARFVETLEELVSHCLAAEGGYTPSDFPDVDLDQDQLDSVLAELDLST